MPQQLGALGYRVGLAGKLHVKPKHVFPFETVTGFDPNCVHDPTNPHDVSPARSFITRAGDQPFCLVIALTEPHVPWVMGDPKEYPPAKIKLPANLADTPRTRQLLHPLPTHRARTLPHPGHDPNGGAAAVKVATTPGT